MPNCWSSELPQYLIFNKQFCFYRPRIHLRTVTGVSKCPRIHAFAALLITRILIGLRPL
ncbi:hypothetical protein PL329_22440 [Escherichia coli]|nr:hypothetical protein [Escherichia coli]WCE53641.1 hypothetical protein PL329_22440 [Escherichia coli]